MESIGTDHVQHLDTEASQVIADCLRNAIVSEDPQMLPAVIDHFLKSHQLSYVILLQIARKILENFPNPQLLKLSLVNKLWNYEARSAMAVRGNVIASLGRVGLCHDMQAFAASLNQINTVPFSGMRISFPANDDSCQCATTALDLTHDISFDPLPFTTLSVQLVGKRWDNQNCRGFLLAKIILQDLSGVIEELSIQMGSNPQSFIQHCVQECTFPRLKILKLEETDLCSLTYQEFKKYIQAFISRVPNLRELHSDGSIRELMNLVKGSAVVPVCSDKILVAFDEIPYDVIAGLLKVRLQRMELVCTTDRDGSFNFDGFKRILPVLLQAPCTSTLSELTVDAVIAASMMRCGVCLENVRKLTMGFNLERLGWRDRHSITRLVVQFNFTRIFPKLSKVHISRGPAVRDFPEGMKTFIRHANYLFENPMPDRAVNIKELHLDCHAVTGNTVNCFAQMFQNIDRLSVENSIGEAGFIFGSIFQHWSHLRELHIKANHLKDTANFDGIFCGIFFDEIVELMQKDEEYLKKVHIVPVMPAVASLRNLRVLNLEYNLGSSPDPTIYDVTNPTFFLSKVTGLIFLARCPNLAVTLRISPDGAQAVSHLKPYLSIEQ